MNILMMTNTYAPIVGGLEKSVGILSDELRKLGHRVIIVAPEFKGSPDKEPNLIRVPAIQRFNGTDFSVKLPIPGILEDKLSQFKPDIVHSHHPFLIGDTALRVASRYNIPLVFTFHTQYEQYTHYVPVDSKALKRFVAELSRGYVNLCSKVIAPSNSIKQLLDQRGVTTPIEVVPTGIYIDDYKKGSRKKFRDFLRLSDDDFLIGTVGRIAPEKNLKFLSEVVTDFLLKKEKAHFLMVGNGPMLRQIEDIFIQKGLRDRLHTPGVLQGEDLCNAYSAMDVFSFASKTETQGLVLAEAAASGTPIVALDAPGVRDVTKDKVNGRLVFKESSEDFRRALEWIYSLEDKELKSLKDRAQKSVSDFSVDNSIERTLTIYNSLKSQGYEQEKAQTSIWENAIRMIKLEVKLLKNMTNATKAAIKPIKLQKKD